MTTAITLSQMADLALGTPEVGAVNFNLLHTLFHAVLQKLDIADVKADVDKADSDFLADKRAESPAQLRPPGSARVKDGSDGRDGGESGIGTDAESIISKDQDPEKKQDSEKEKKSVPKTKTDSESPPVSAKRSPYHKLQDKVDRLEKQMDELNSLPSNEDLFDRTKAKGDQPEQRRPISDMWQNMQMGKKVAANEEGVGKLMSLVQDLMSQVQKLTDDNADLKKKMENASDLDELRKKLKDLENMTNEMKQKMNNMPPPSIDIDTSDYVTWTGLEDALRGIRDQLHPEERVVIEMASQTEMPSRPVSRASRMSTPGPSAELMEILERLGVLGDKHDVLEGRVTDIEEQLKNKADKADLEGLGISEELLQKLKDMQEQLEAVKKSKDKPIEIPIPRSNGSKEELASDLKDLSDCLSNAVQTHDEQIRHIVGEIKKIYGEIDKLGNRHGEQLDSLNDQVKALEAKLQELQEALDNRGAEESEEELVEEEAPPSEEPQDPSKLANMEKAMASKAAELRKLHEKVKLLTQDTNRQLAEAKERLKDVEEESKNFSQKLEEILSGGRGANISDMDSDALSRMQHSLQQLQAELERLSNTTQHLIDDNNNKQKNIDTLFTICSKLEENKADKEFVQNEVEVKADKRHLDSKVNRALFDTTCDDLNKMINDILCKLSGHDEEWKKALGQLTDDLDGKLDRLEFGPIRDELERQLRALAKKLGQVHYPMDNDDDAAGLRKQIVQKFNCISCDRPVDMQPQGPIPSIPAPSGLPATRSARPYTTFELEQIRQHAKAGHAGKNLINFERAVVDRQLARCHMQSNFRAFLWHFGSNDPPAQSQRKGTNMSGQPQIDIMDLYATARACGGNHTLTYPHRRATRMATMNTLFRDDDVPVYKNELDIQGADGHVYKGRMVNGETRLPDLASGGQGVTQNRSPKPMRKAHTTLANTHTAHIPGAPTTPRPNSARVMRPQSGVGSPRPLSAAGRQQHAADIPTGTDSPQPPPAPAPSEPGEFTDSMIMQQEQQQQS